MKNKSQKRGLGGEQKEEEKASEETKVYKEKTKTNKIYEDNGNVFGIEYSDDDNKLASDFEKLSFNEKLDVFSEIVIRYDNETYFEEKLTFVTLTFDSNSNGFDFAKRIQDFKN